MDFFLSVVVGVSLATWLYSKILQPRQPDSVKPLIASAIVGLLVTVIFFFLIRTFLPQ